MLLVQPSHGLSDNSIFTCSQRHELSSSGILMQNESNPLAWSEDKKCISIFGCLYFIISGNVFSYPDTIVCHGKIRSHVRIYTPYMKLFHLGEPLHASLRDQFNNKAHFANCLFIQKFFGQGRKTYLYHVNDDGLSGQEFLVLKYFFKIEVGCMNPESNRFCPIFAGIL